MSAPFDHSNHYLQALDSHPQNPPFLSDPKLSFGLSVNSIPPTRIPTDVLSQRRARDKSNRWTILLLGALIWVPIVAGLTCLFLYILFMRLAAWSVCLARCGRGCSITDEETWMPYVAVDSTSKITSISSAQLDSPTFSVSRRPYRTSSPKRSGWY
jgi:hypothetical protein